MIMTTHADNDVDGEIERFRKQLMLASDDQRRIEVIGGFLDVVGNAAPRLALEHAGEAFRLASQLGRIDVAANMLRHRGFARLDLGEDAAGVSDLEEAYEMMSRATELSPDVPYDKRPEQMASVALALGEHANRLGDPTTALQWYMSALDACESIDNRSARIKVFEALGHLYSGLGDYTRALEHHFESLALLDGNADADALGVTYAAIGTTYALSGDYDEAYGYVMRALSEFRKGDNRYLEVGALSNLSSILYSQDELTTALEYALTAVTIYEALDDELHAAASLVTVGKIYERQSDLDAALHCYLRAMRLLGDDVDEQLHISILASIGTIYRLTGAYNEALFMFDQALRIAQEIEEPRFEYQLHESLSQVYEDLALPAQALEHHKSFARLRNEIAGQERQKAIAELHVRFEVDRATREREVLRARTRDLEAEMERKQSELTSLALNLVQKNELLDTLKSRMRKLGERSQMAPRKVVDNLITEIDANRSSDANWKLFEQQLEIIHPDMQRRLSERFPSLTPTELKVCSLTAINLSNKDMASLLYMSIRTVESHRLSARRKLDLPKDANLKGFLASLSAATDE